MRRRFRRAVLCSADFVVGHLVGSKDLVVVDSKNLAVADSNNLVAVDPCCGWLQKPCSGDWFPKPGGFRGRLNLGL